MTAKTRSQKALWLPPFSLGVHSIGSQQRCPEDTRAALGRGLHGEELRPPANSHVSGSREQILLPQIRHPMPAAPLNISTAPHDRPGARLTQLSRSQISNPQKSCEIMILLGVWVGFFFSFLSLHFLRELFLH